MIIGYFGRLYSEINIFEDLINVFLKKYYVETAN